MAASMMYSTVGFPELNTSDSNNSHLLGVFYLNCAAGDVHLDASSGGGAPSPLVNYGGRSSGNASLDRATCNTAWILNNSGGVAFRHTPLLYVNALNTSSAYGSVGAGSALASGETGFSIILTDDDGDLDGAVWPFGDVVVGKVGTNEGVRTTITAASLGVGTYFANYVGTGVPTTVYAVADAVAGTADVNFNIADQAAGAMTTIIIKDFLLDGVSGGGNDIIDNSVIV